MDYSLDKKFISIGNLKWLPFVGDKYLTIPKDKKLLIIGESHYHDNTKQSIDKHERNSFTREVIEELAIDRDYYDTKIFPNFHRALFKNDNFNTNVFWNLTSFYNFVQRPMETNKGRPNYDDFYNGWLTFFDTIKVLQPKTCLFIGTEASNSIRGAINKSDFDLISFEKEEKISGTYPRKIVIKDEFGKEIKLFFIRHTSNHFSWKKWNDYLLKSMNNQIIWFEDKIKSI